MLTGFAWASLGTMVPTMGLDIHNVHLQSSYREFHWVLLVFLLRGPVAGDRGRLVKVVAFIHAHSAETVGQGQAALGEGLNVLAQCHRGPPGWSSGILVFIKCI